MDSPSGVCSILATIKMPMDSAVDCQRRRYFDLVKLLLPKGAKVFRGCQAKFRVGKLAVMRNVSSATGGEPSLGRRNEGRS